MFMPKKLRKKIKTFKNQLPEYLKKLDLVESKLPEIKDPDELRKVAQESINMARNVINTFRK